MDGMLCFCGLEPSAARSPYRRVKNYNFLAYLLRTAISDVGHASSKRELLCHESTCRQDRQPLFVTYRQSRKFDTELGLGAKANMLKFLENEWRS